MFSAKEYIKKFNTCAAKWNLIFAYTSAAEIKWKEVNITEFAIIRNYSDFCYLDTQRLIINMYPDMEYDWNSLEQKMNALDEFLTMVLKNIDNRPT